MRMAFPIRGRWVVVPIRGRWVVVPIAAVALLGVVAFGPRGLAPSGAQAGAAADGEAERADLEVARAVEARVMDVAQRVLPAVVAVAGGAGFLISPDGEVLTNHHVIDERDEFRVHVGDRAYPARVVGTDPYGDVALLRLEGAEGLPCLPLGDSGGLHVGEPLLALGNPYGLGADGAPAAVSFGVVSARDRYQGGYAAAIQTDAALNPGNSGGPVVDLDGRVVGIAGRIAVRFGDRLNTGVGYAIPVDQVRRFLPRLRAGGRVAHGAVEGLGVRREDPGRDGARVVRVLPGSAAETAGIRPGDRIVAVDEMPTPSGYRFHGILGTYPADTPLALRLVRGGREREVRVVLSPRTVAGAPETPGEAFLGIRYAASALIDLGGIEIDEVIAGSAAEAAGLRRGDILTHLGGQDVIDTGALVLALTGRVPGDAVEVRVIRGTTRFSVRLVLGKRGG